VRAVAQDPFQALGLAARPDLTDDEVRAAWRRIAAATHPDRADGGDPARFAAAAAAYSVLRTGYGRGEVRADLHQGPSAGAGVWLRGGPLRLGRVRLGRVRGGRLTSRVLRGRPGRLALRVLAAAAVSAGSLAVAGWQPATPALMAGALTWLIRTGRHDLAPAVSD
jgi:hypothetical protein